MTKKYYVIQPFMTEESDELVKHIDGNDLITTDKESEAVHFFDIEEAKKFIETNKEVFLAALSFEPIILEVEEYIKLSEIDVVDLEQYIE